jgi:hypothetical protein
MLSCVGALLAVLPPDPQPATWANADFKAAEHAVAAIFTSQMTTSDIAAFRVMVRGEHQDEEIVRRFHRLGEERRKRLLEFLRTDDVKWSARARETALRRAARSSAPQTDPSSGSDDAAGADAGTADSSDTSADAGSAASNEVSTPHADAGEAAKAPAEPSSAMDQAAPRREPHGSAIAALVPGTTYEGDGVFRIAAQNRQVTARIQRVRTARRVHHGAGDHVVIEIPNGLSDAEFVEAVAEQLRVVHSDLAAASAVSAALQRRTFSAKPRVQRLPEPQHVSRRRFFRHAPAPRPRRARYWPARRRRPARGAAPTLARTPRVRSSLRSEV